MGGEIQGRLHPRDENEASEARARGYDLDKILEIDDLVASDDVFFALTGITDGELVDGVKYYGGGARTHSLVMRARTGTVREIIATHRWDKLMVVSQIRYDRLG
jgi:fructose-1,6-bisphosphatase II